MVIRIIRITIGLHLLMLLLICCSYPSSEGLPQNESSQYFAPFQVDTIDRLTEIDKWEIMEKDEAISFIKYNLALNQLTVSSEQGKIVLFDVEKEEVISQQNVDNPNLRVLDTDEKGERLLMGLSDQRLNEHGKPQQFFHWFGFWNTQKGSLDKCLSGSCDNELTDPDHIAYAYIGAVMDSDTVITFSEDSYVVTILSPENGGGISLVNSPDADYWWHIGKVAVNSDQNQIAIVFQEGRITLNKISKPEYLPLSWIDVLEKGEENQLQTVEEAIFDPSGRWLVVVRGQYLAIWQVNGWKRELFRDEIDNFRGMMFTPSSELLFIAKENTVSVISLEEREVVFEMQSPGIASLDISDDNRLLFWGDENGAVHVWGIPLP